MILKKFTINLLLVISLFIIFRFTMLPDPNLGIGTTRGELNLIPFKIISSNFTNLDQFIINIGGNILLFVPFGFFTALRFRKNYNVKIVVLIGLFLSVIIECIQIWITNRWTDIDDVILNTIGAYLGVALMRLLQKWTRSE